MAYRRKDAFYHRAKREGFAARAVYKLQEMDRRFRLFRKGQRVLDLGCAPGSWLQYAATCVGPQGKLVGVDLAPVTASLPSWVRILQEDLFHLDPQTAFPEAPFDLVLSDAAPKTTGIRFTDQVRSYELSLRALEIALSVLREGGGFVCKIFQGPQFPEFLRKVRSHFKKTSTFKPKSSRSESFETYLIAQRLCPS